MNPTLKEGQTLTKFKCPMCPSLLVSEPGSRTNPTLGVTLFCPSLECPAQEVMGYGKDDTSAFKIITERFNFASK